MKSVITKRVMIDFHKLQNNRMKAGTNQVQKVPLMVMGDDSELFIKLLLDNDGGGQGGGSDNIQLTESAGVGRVTMETRCNMMEAQELHYMNYLLVHLREDNNVIRGEVATCHE